MTEGETRNACNWEFSFYCAEIPQSLSPSGKLIIPITAFGIVTCAFMDNLSQNSCIINVEIDKKCTLICRVQFVILIIICH